MRYSINICLAAVLTGLLYSNAEASSVETPQTVNTPIVSYQHGVPMSPDEMDALLAGQGCLGLFGEWYGSDQCCKEAAVAVLILSLASQVTQWATVGASELSLYIIISC